MAEDGDTGSISAEFLKSGNSIDGTLIGIEGAEGPIDPRETVSQTFTLDSEDPNSRFLNYASMVLPSNDAFIANGDPSSVYLTNRVILSAQISLSMVMKY